MQRRIALAISLAFTTIVAVALLAVGSSAGWFSDATKRPKTAVAQTAPAAAAGDDYAASLRYLAAIQGTPSEPNVVTEYVYVNGDDGTPQRAPAPRAQGNTVPPVAGQPTVPPQATAAAPTDVPPPSATAASASATPQPATPTQPTQPTARAAASSTPCPTEFVSTVTAIQPAGSATSVTWANGAVTLVVAGTPGGAGLAPGAKAHVHAMALSAGCTATEIDTGG